MPQKSLLLYFKTKVSETNYFKSESMSYNLAKGLWESKKRSPIVKQMFCNSKIKVHGVTLVTATREGTDRSERS